MSLFPRGPCASAWRLCQNYYQSSCQNHFHPVFIKNVYLVLKATSYLCLSDSTPDLPFPDIGSPASAPAQCDTSLSFSWSPLLSETRYAADSQANPTPAWRSVRPLPCGTWPGLVRRGEVEVTPRERVRVAVYFYLIRP